MSKALIYGLLTLVMIIWGLNVIAIKILVEYFSPITMQAVRIFIAGLLVLLILFFQKDLRMLTKREWYYTLFAALLGHVAHHALLAKGLVETTASNTALILGLLPLTTAIFAYAFLKETMTRLRVVGIILGFTGVALVILNNGELGGVSQGDLYILLCMIAQAISFIFIKKVTKTLSAKQLTGYMMIIGSVSMLLLSFIFEPNGAQTLTEGTSWVWVILLSSAILATGLGHIFYNMAINEIGAGKTAIFNNLVPFFALIAAVLFLKETLYVTQVLGFILIVSGVLLGTGYVDVKIHQRKLKQAS